MNEIEIVDYDFKGYWESQDWPDYTKGIDLIKDTVKQHDGDYQKPYI